MRFYNNLTISQKQIVWAWIFLALPVLFYVVIRFYPTANAFVLSFQEWNLLGDRKYVGLENYAKLFSDPVFWKVFKNTFMYLILGTPVSLVLSFIIAYHLLCRTTQHVRERRHEAIFANCVDGYFAEPSSGVMAAPCNHASISFQGGCSTISVPDNAFHNTI